jgi:hypothetical protein
MIVAAGSYYAATEVVVVDDVAVADVVLVLLDIEA